MAEVFSEWLEKLKSKADIAEVVSHYVSLQERGSRRSEERRVGKECRL